MMFVEVAHHDQICILRFRGRFASGAQLEYLEAKLAEIRALGLTGVVADLSEVSSIGSTGLGFVVSIFASVTTRSAGRFIMFGLNPRVRKAFEVTRLTEILPVASDMDSALAHLRQLARPSGDDGVLSAGC